MLAAGRDVAEMGAAYGETAATMAETARFVSSVTPEMAVIVAATTR